MGATHAVTMSGTRSLELKGDDRAVRADLTRLLSRLDGSGRFSMSLWRLPTGIDFDDVDLANWPDEYLQCAGSAERMTIEQRSRLADGTFVLEVVGRSTDPEGEQPAPAEVVLWSEYQNLVRHDEVFTASEAVEIFCLYYADGDLPAGFTRRRIEI